MNAITKRQIFPCALVPALSLGGCTNPYDPVPRTIAGGLIGAGSGAAIGAAVAGGHGAVLAPLSEERWVRWADLSLRHCRRLGTATNPRTPARARTAEVIS
jgi:hypothetical protein